VKKISKKSTECRASLLFIAEDKGQNGVFFVGKSIKKSKKEKNKKSRKKFQKFEKNA